MEPPVLDTARLRLRAYVDTDIDAIHEACQDPEIQRWTPIPVPFLRTHAEKFVTDSYPQGWREDTHRILGAFCRRTGALVTNLSMIPTAPKVFEIGYWTSSAQRGKGCTVEALDAFVRWIFRSLDAQRIEWQGLVGNPGSWAVAAHVGFRLEGTLRARAHLRGVARDTEMGGLLPADLGLPAH